MGRIARALVTGYGFAEPFNGHSGPTAWCPPLYPLLLAAVFKLFGVYTLKSGWVILTINSIFSAATAVAIYEIAWRCFGRTAQGLKIALWSAWLWALYPAAMQYAVKWLWDMALTAFLFAWVIVLALRIRGVGSCQLETRSEPVVRQYRSQQIEQPRPQLATSNQQPLTLWLLFGLLWGLIALSNSSLLTFLPACGLWILWPALRRLGAPFMASSDMGGAPPASLVGRMGGIKSAFTGPILSALLFLAVISPWVIRNWVVFHAFVPMRANFGAELYEATMFSNDGFPWMATLPLAETAPEFRRYERLGEIAYSKQQGEIAKAKIHAHPGLFARNALRRVYFFWISVPHPTDSGVVRRSHPAHQLLVHQLRRTARPGPRHPPPRPSRVALLLGFRHHSVHLLLRHRAGALPPSVGAHNLRARRLPLPVRRPHSKTALAEDRW